MAHVVVAEGADIPVGGTFRTCSSWRLYCSSALIIVKIKLGMPSFSSSFLSEFTLVLPWRTGARRSQVPGADTDLTLGPAPHFQVPSCLQHSKFRTRSNADMLP